MKQGGRRESKGASYSFLPEVTRRRPPAPCTGCLRTRLLGTSYVDPALEIIVSKLRERNSKGRGEEVLSAVAHLRPATSLLLPFLLPLYYVVLRGVDAVCFKLLKTVD